jgi:hypothetical protein
MKIKMMVFSKGRKVKQEDRSNYGQEWLIMVKCYKYLGITLRISGKKLNMHIKETAASESRAMADIQSLSKLSLETALKLFSLKIVSILTYGLEIIWNVSEKTA